MGTGAIREGTVERLRYVYPLPRGIRPGEKQWFAESSGLCRCLLVSQRVAGIGASSVKAPAPRIRLPMASSFDRGCILFRQFVCLAYFPPHRRRLRTGLAGGQG